MKRKIKMTLAYDGTAYQGWQRQDNTDNTIQETIENCFYKILGTKVELQASGRTDAGVHARGQCVSFSLEEKSLKKFEKNFPEKEAQSILKEFESSILKNTEDSVLYLLHCKLNDTLPKDIQVQKLVYVPKDFHARLSATTKTYSYQIWNGNRPSVFLRKYCYQVAEPLDIEKMKLAAKELVGTHDFHSFTSDKKKEKSMTRRIDNITFEQDGEFLRIRYEGEGFLYHMVRIMTGTLIEVGLGKREISSIAKALTSDDRAQAGYMVPPQGLFLDEVTYMPVR